jgi:hypothetical protein
VGVKIALAVILCALAALVSGRAQAPASSLASSPTAAGIFVVRPDPRECPSPLCGGYWVSLANHARTRCSDGLLRPRCYVASVLDARDTDELGPVSDSLAQGVLDFQAAPDFGRLGRLTVTAVWGPVGRTPASGRFFRLRDTGVRCVRAPCFSIRARALNSSAHPSAISAMKLGPAQAGSLRSRAEKELAGTEGLLAAGRIVATSDGGRLFEATQVYFRAPKPRA